MRAQSLSLLTTGLRAGSSSSRTTARAFSSSASTSNSSSSSSGSSSALDDLSTSLEKLARSRTSPSSPSGSSPTVFNPRSPQGAPASRQTVSGRAFMNGHYYNPHTLSYNSITSKPARLSRPLLGPTKAVAVTQDLIHINGLNPGKPSLADDSYKNAAILAQYVSEMGKIQGRASTGLTRKSQRMVGKAVRRARAMGLLPVMSRGGTRVGGAGWK